MRPVIFFAIAILLFLPFNVIAWRQLVRIHPRRKRWIAAAMILGNLMWPFFPLLRSFTPFARVTRALLGPPWIAWTMFLIVYAAFLFVVLLAWIPFHRRAAFAEFARWPSRVFLALVLLGGAVGYYQAIVPLRVERVPIRIANLPPSLHGTRLALLGDLHVGLFTRRSRLDEIFTTTASLRPDLVLIAGDMIDDDPHFVPKLLEGTRTLPASIPLLGVVGNHEIYGDPRAVIAGLRNSRIRLLVNEPFAWRDLWIAGVSDRAAAQMGRKELAPDLRKALHGKPPNAMSLVLSHQPAIIAEARKHGAQLTLCAHTHGGQMGFRPLRWSVAGIFLPYHMGRYDLPPTQLYINTGTGYWLLPFRLGMTPEITLIELLP